MINNKMPYAELLNGIDEIAEKLTTAEYQNLMNLLQKSQQQEPQQEQQEYYKLVYEQITIVPYDTFDDENNEILCLTKEIQEENNVVYGRLENIHSPNDTPSLINRAITDGYLTYSNLETLQSNYINKNVIKNRGNHVFIYRIKSLLKM
tara:strand:+ start:7485 stop:7931 length:447 start_codon:yes stop_codon:yes gene_type:complete